jgi:hypothetical protein
MQSGERIVTCSDAAKETLKYGFFLTAEEHRACLRKAYGRSGHDTPEEKMWFAKLLWDVREEAAESLFGPATAATPA